MNKKFPYLPEGRIIKYVDMNNVFMKEAMRLRNEQSTDENHPTGAVVVLDNQIIGRAVNKSSISNKTLIKLHSRGFCIRKILHIPSGQKYWLCPGCAKLRYHAEISAVRNALSNRESIAGADLYLYGHWWCCKSCWGAMIKADIRDVYLLQGADELFV